MARRSRGNATVISMDYFLLRRPTSGELMLIALLIGGILAVAIAGLVFLSAMQDIADDY